MSTANTRMHAFKVVTIEMTTLRAKMCMAPLTNGDRQRAVADRRETVHAEPADAASETVLDRAWNSVLSEGDNSWIGKHFTSLTIHGAVMPLGESVCSHCWVCGGRRGFEGTRPCRSEYTGGLQVVLLGRIARCDGACCQEDPGMLPVRCLECASCGAHASPQELSTAACAAASNGGGDAHSNGVSGVYGVATAQSRRGCSDDPANVSSAQVRVMQWAMGRLCMSE
jgi:hypothetical protein